VSEPVAHQENMEYCNPTAPLDFPWAVEQHRL
jgi:hypothetical protein